MAKKFRENVEIISTAVNTSGLQLMHLTSASPATAGSKTISVDATGNVVIAPATVIVSADANNSITAGTDGGAYYNAPALVTNATWNDATNTIAITFDDASVVNVPIVDNVSSFLSDFSITDWTNTDVVSNHETVTFQSNANLADVIKFETGANLVTTSINTTGATVGDTFVYNGTKVVWDKPTADRYVNAYTPTANTATTHTHALNTARPIVQVFDTTTGEVIWAEIIRLSATQFNVIVTTVDPITVVAV